MGFIVGLVIGLIVGITIIIGFVKAENYRSKLRSELANTVAAFARMTVEDSRKLLPAEFYPSWVVFSERQKLTWLNHHLTKIWPYVDEAASELIKASVEPVLEQYRPAIVASLTFSKLTLGTVAPQFTGVSIVEGDKNGMTMELDMNWDGNPNIVLGIKTLVVGKSDPFAKMFIRPLREKTQRSKTINNDLNPIWNEHFEFVVEDASTQHLVVRVYDDEGVQASELLGCAQIRLCELEPGKVKDVWLKLVKDLEIQRDNKNRGEVHLELLYVPFGAGNGVNPFTSSSMTSLEKVLKNDTADEVNASSRKRKDVIVRGVLSVTVISAEEIPIQDLMGKADPFVVLSMKKSGAKSKTRVVNDSLNPVWNQTFDFVVEDGLHDMLVLEVWDHDTFGKDYIGRCILTLTRVIMEEEYTDWFELDESKAGKLQLHLKWMAQSIYRDS
ncbi:hypothetical protein BRARA_J00373 [Brassica rapa]|uniref:Synaptotagmin-5-like n=1 Tax=Brassica campestris TaxID=3711 RepID=A0A397XPF5_BRACM|nr:hypothetical protein BRARA_J00373 [Brassica rapa]